MQPCNRMAHSESHTGCSGGGDEPHEKKKQNNKPHCLERHPACAVKARSPEVTIAPLTETLCSSRSLGCRPASYPPTLGAICSSPRSRLPFPLFRRHHFHLCATALPPLPPPPPPCRGWPSEPPPCPGSCHPRHALREAARAAASPRSPPVERACPVARDHAPAAAVAGGGRPPRPPRLGGGGGEGMGVEESLAPDSRHWQSACRRYAARPGGRGWGGGGSPYG